MKLRAMIAALMVALATPAFAGIFDYESLHMRLAAVLGSRTKADAVYEKLMQQANGYGQPIEFLVDTFVNICMASDDCTSK